MPAYCFNLLQNLEQIVIYEVHYSYSLSYTIYMHRLHSFQANYDDMFARRTIA